MGLMLSWLLSHSLRTKMLALFTLAWLFLGLTQTNVLCVMFQVKKKLLSLGNFYNLCCLYNLYGSCFMFYYFVIILTFSLLNFYNLCFLYYSYGSYFIFCYLAIILAYILFPWLDHKPSGDTYFILDFAASSVPFGLVVCV